MKIEIIKDCEAKCFDHNYSKYAIPYFFKGAIEFPDDCIKVIVSGSAPVCKCGHTYSEHQDAGARCKGLAGQPFCPCQKFEPAEVEKSCRNCDWQSCATMAIKSGEKVCESWIPKPAAEPEKIPEPKSFSEYTELNDDDKLKLYNQTTDLSRPKPITENSAEPKKSCVTCLHYLDGHDCHTLDFSCWQPKLVSEKLDKDLQELRYENIIASGREMDKRLTALEQQMQAVERIYCRSWLR